MSGFGIALETDVAGVNSDFGALSVKPPPGFSDSVQFPFACTPLENVKGVEFGTERFSASPAPSVPYMYMSVLVLLSCGNPYGL